jgi:hypothetical protein
LQKESEFETPVALSELGFLSRPPIAEFVDRGTVGLSVRLAVLQPGQAKSGGKHDDYQVRHTLSRGARRCSDDYHGICFAGEGSASIKPGHIHRYHFENLYLYGFNLLGAFWRRARWKDNDYSEHLV